MKNFVPKPVSQAEAALRLAQHHKDARVVPTFGQAVPQDAGVPNPAQAGKPGRAHARDIRVSGCYVGIWGHRIPHARRRAFWDALRKAFRELRCLDLGIEAIVTTKIERGIVALQNAQSVKTAPLRLDATDLDNGSLRPTWMTDIFVIRVKNPYQRDALFHVAARFNGLKIDAGAARLASKIRCPDQGFGRSMTVDAPIGEGA